MTTTQRIKEALIAYLTANNPTSSIQIADAQKLEAIQLPCVAVDIQGPEPHSVALQMVKRGEVIATIRQHSGDASEIDVSPLAQKIDELFSNYEEMVRVLNESGVQFYEWVYSGPPQDWDASTLEISFMANIMFARI